MRKALRSSPFRVLAVMALLCVLVMRVAIPTGYMLDEGTEGWPHLIACPADSPIPPLHMAMAGHGDGTHHPHDHKNADHPCAFAAASAAVDQAALPVAAILPHERPDAALPLRMFARPGLGLAAPPPPQTGPPAIA